MVALDGETFTYLSPVGDSDLRGLPDDAITSAILPVEWNSLTKVEMLTKVPASAKLNTETGALTF